MDGSSRYCPSSSGSLEPAMLLPVKVGGGTLIPVPVGSKPRLDAPYSISLTLPASSTKPYFPCTSPSAYFDSILYEPSAAS